MTTDANAPTGINAKVIADSVSPLGVRCTTLEATMHRFVLAEFNTHRVFSRNSASSRAIPFAKQVERIRNNTAVPVSFPAEQRGMQGGEELTDPLLHAAQVGWTEAAKRAVASAEYLAELGVHKSVTNRILEPFMWHTVIVTATEWDGFWEQRCSPLAQPEIRVVAELMRDVYNDSTPTPLDYGDWHLPYIEAQDVEATATYLESLDTGVVYNYDNVDVLLRQVSSARCARVSYLTHDGVRSIDKDIELYQRLTSARPWHASPLEHVATPSSQEYTRGNLRGWRQFRHIVEKDMQ